MDVDFGHAYNAGISDEYKDKLKQEWVRLDADRTGFIQVADYGTLYARMFADHGFSLGRIFVAEEFSVSDHISFRRFCLYAEQDELYTDFAGARLIDEHTLAYDIYTDSYEGYKDRCLTHLRSELGRGSRYYDVGDHSGEPEFIAADEDGHDPFIQDMDTYETAFEAEDSAHSGYVDRAGFYRILGSLVRGYSNWSGPAMLVYSECIVDVAEGVIRMDAEFSNGVSPLPIAPETLPRHLEDFCAGFNKNEERWRAKFNGLPLFQINNRCPAVPHLDAEGCPKQEWDGTPTTYRVSLRQFCCFIERPPCDMNFPNRAFTSWLQRCRWTTLIHRLIIRYWPSSLFVKQIKELLMLRQRSLLASIVLHAGIFAFLHRDGLEPHDAALQPAAVLQRVPAKTPLTQATRSPRVQEIAQTACFGL
jgi:hypothetical protein